MVQSFLVWHRTREYDVKTQSPVLRSGGHQQGSKSQLFLIKSLQKSIHLERRAGSEAFEQVKLQLLLAFRRFLE